MELWVTNLSSDVAFTAMQEAFFVPPDAPYQHTRMDTCFSTRVAFLLGRSHSFLFLMLTQAPFSVTSNNYGEEESMLLK